MGFTCISFTRLEGRCVPLLPVYVVSTTIPKGRARDTAKFQLVVLGDFSSSLGCQNVTPFGVLKAGLMNGGACQAGHPWSHWKAGVIPEIGERKLGVDVKPSLAPPKPGDFSGA